VSSKPAQAPAPSEMDGTGACGTQRKTAPNGERSLENLSLGTLGAGVAQAETCATRVPLSCLLRRSARILVWKKRFWGI